MTLDRYGTRGTRHPRHLDRGDIIMCVPRYLRRQVKSSCLYLLISWHFISPKRIFYFNVDKETSSSASASAGLRLPMSPTMAVSVDPAAGLPSPRPRAMSPTTVETDRHHCTPVCSLNRTTECEFVRSFQSTIRYDTMEYINVRLRLSSSQLSLPHGTKQKIIMKKLTTKKRRRSKETVRS